MNKVIPPFVLAMALFMLPLVGLTTPAQAQNTELPLVLQMDGDIWAYSPGSNTLTQLTTWGYNGLPVASPDSKTIAYSSVAELAIEVVRRFGNTTSTPPRNIWLWNLPSGQSARVADQPPASSFGSSSGTDNFARRSTPAWSPDGTMITWVEELVSQSASATSVQAQLIIYDMNLLSVRAAVPLSVSGASTVAYSDPVWGKSGIAVRATLSLSGGKASDAFLVYDSTATLRADLRVDTSANPIMMHVWATQNGQEYLALGFRSNAWVLINAANSSQLNANGLPEVYAVAAPNGITARFILQNDQLAWTARISGGDVVLPFAGPDSQLAISPDGNRLAYVSDAVYVVANAQAGGNTVRVPGSERPTGKDAKLAWGYKTWRIGSGVSSPPPVAGGDTACAGAPKSRLSVGITARVTLSPPQPNALNSKPARPSRDASSQQVTLIPVGGVFTVVAGPTCNDGLLWWNVVYNGLSGWTAEGDSTAYWVEPYANTGACAPNLPPRLFVGGQGRVVPGDPNAIRNQPTTNNASSQTIGVVPGGAVFSVVNGPVCADGFTWWQVNYSGVTGWTPEGQDYTYWVDPLYCGFQMPSRLMVGRQGRVTPGLPNILRTYPSTNNTISGILGEIPAGGLFKIVSGPQCGDGYIWWEVNYNNITGWTPEGQAKIYWTEPVN
jgi:hypothetical protein